MNSPVDERRAAGSKIRASGCWSDRRSTGLTMKSSRRTPGGGITRGILTMIGCKSDAPQSASKGIGCAKEVGSGEAEPPSGQRQLPRHRERRAVVEARRAEWAICPNIRSSRGHGLAAPRLRDRSPVDVGSGQQPAPHREHAKMLRRPSLHLQNPFNQRSGRRTSTTRNRLHRGQASHHLFDNRQMPDQQRVGRLAI